MITRYSRPAMTKIWTPVNRYQAWLEVELAVMAAWVKEGRVPADALESVRQKAQINVERIQEIEEKTRHDVIAFITSLEEQLGPESRYIHLGCTSSDILDTANALLVQQAGKVLLDDLTELEKVLSEIAHKYKGVLCMGRTHGVHAEPTSFGLKIAGFYVEFKRHRERLKSALDDMAVGKISGAVGTYAFLSPQLEKVALKALGLRPDPHSTQIVQRDRYAYFFTVLAILGGGIERVALELRHLQRTEVLEAEEGFRQGQKGSSAMPHKKNPISAENLCGISRVLRGNALASLENQALWHERDISHSSVERIIMPDSTILADYALARLTALLSKLSVHPDAMLKNMAASYDLYFSQRILTALIGAGLSRQKAYEAVQACAMQSWNEKIPFPHVVCKDALITQYLNKDQLQTLFDPNYYLKYENEIFERIFDENS